MIRFSKVALLVIPEAKEHGRPIGKRGKECQEVIVHRRECDTVEVFRVHVFLATITMTMTTFNIIHHRICPNMRRDP
jgi:hypothetical protein